MQTNLPLPGVVISLHHTNLQTISDSSGQFYFENLIPGTYSLKFMYVGYQSLIFPRIDLKAKSNQSILAEMIQSQEQGNVFYIGGIEITAEREQLSDKIYTTKIIKSNEIEHIQAMSLGDVLNLVPGTELLSYPALKEEKRSLMRDTQDFDEISSSSTKIIVDGIPLSNDANLQDANSTFYGATTNAGLGIDLREIPADNIDQVEVIQGIAPARHGNYLTGVVNVTSKTSANPFFRIKAKTNPDTKELNAGGSLNLLGTGINYNVNYGYSYKNIRDEYDNAHRFAIQTTFCNLFFQHKLQLKSSLRFTKLFDDINLDPSDEYSLKTYNHGYRFNYSIVSDLKLNSTLLMRQNVYLNYREVNSYKQKYNPPCIQILSPLTAPGTTAAFKRYDGYLYKYTTKGKEISLGLEWELVKKMFLKNEFHEISLGLQHQFDKNYGEGRKFDILAPQLSGDRPRAFDSIPGALNHSVFVNDEITYQKLSLNCGLRFDAYSSTAVPLLQAPHGYFFNKRFNIAYSVVPNLRLRLGYGEFSKSPTLNYIYPEAKYLDFFDVIPVINENDTLAVPDSVISTYVFDQSNTRLKGFQERKWELSLDYFFGNVDLTITGFYRYRENEPQLTTVPFIYFRYYRPNWPHSGDEQIIDTYLDYYQQWTNGAWGKYDGIEFHVNTNRFKKFNISFTFDATYYHSKHGRYGLDFGEPKNLQLPFYRSHLHWFQKLIFNYQIHYTCKSLGMWVALIAQHVPLSVSKTIGSSDSVAIAYYDGLTGKIYDIPRAQQKNEEYDIFHRYLFPQTYELWKYPQKWIFNFRISKSVFNGAEISFFVNNLFNERAFYKTDDISENYSPRNPEIFYGLEFSMLLNHQSNQSN